MGGDDGLYPSPPSPAVPRTLSAAAEALELPMLAEQPRPDDTLAQPAAGDADAGPAVARADGTTTTAPAAPNDATNPADGGAEPTGAAPAGADVDSIDEQVGIGMTADAAAGESSAPATGAGSGADPAAPAAAPVKATSTPATAAAARSPPPPQSPKSPAPPLSTPHPVNIGLDSVSDGPLSPAPPARASPGSRALIPAASAGVRPPHTKSVPSYSEVVVLQVTEDPDAYSHGLAIAQRLIEVYPRDVQVTRCRLDQLWTGRPGLAYSKHKERATPKVQVRLVDIHSTTPRVEQTVARYGREEQDGLHSVAILLPPPEAFGDADRVRVKGTKEHKLHHLREVLWGFTESLMEVPRDLSEPPVDAAVRIETIVDRKIQLLRKLYARIDASVVHHVSRIPADTRLALYDSKNLQRQQAQYIGYTMGRYFKGGKRPPAPKPTSDTHAYQPPKFKYQSPKDSAFTYMHKIKCTPAATRGRRPPVEILTVDRNYKQVELAEDVLEEKAELLDKLASRCQRVTSMPTGFAYERTGVLCNMQQGEGRPDHILYFEHYDVPFAMRKREAAEAAKAKDGKDTSSPASSPRRKDDVEAGGGVSPRRPLWQRSPSPDHDIPDAVKKTINLHAKALRGFGRLEKAIVLEGQDKGTLQHLIEHAYSGSLSDQTGGATRAEKRHLDQTVASTCFWKELPKHAPKDEKEVRYDPTPAEAAVRGMQFQEASWSAMAAKMNTATHIETTGGTDASPPAATATSTRDVGVHQKNVMDKWMHHHFDTQEALRARLLLPLNVKENHPAIRPGPEPGVVSTEASASEEARPADPSRRVPLNWIRQGLGNIAKEEWCLQRYCHPPPRDGKMVKARSRSVPPPPPPLPVVPAEDVPALPQLRPSPPNTLVKRVHPSMKRLPPRSLAHTFEHAHTVPAPAGHGGTTAVPTPPPSPPLVSPKKPRGRLRVSKHPGRVQGVTV